MSDQYDSTVSADWYVQTHDLEDRRGPPATPLAKPHPTTYPSLLEFSQENDIDESVPSGRCWRIVTNFPHSAYGGPMVSTWCDRCGSQIGVPSLHPGPYVCVLCLKGFGL